MVLQNDARRRLTLTQVLFHAGGAALLSTGVAGEGVGFGFCAPPLKPACVDAPAATGTCEEDVQLYVRSVFTYRACLEKETERAVREANETLGAWRCRKDPARCR
ncbi:MAG: hypothetical protein ACR652_18830 [Methylocystis sp.]|uniref:hypothetical protein n=1 Tax=Methylocystis sp. TaxID=1911079 RepID=UPI003DA58D7C